MDIQAEKIELIKLIADIDSEKVLKKIKDLLTSKEKNSPYSPEFKTKMKQSEEDVTAGRTTKIQPADIWNLG